MKRACKHAHCKCCNNNCTKDLVHERETDPRRVVVISNDHAGEAVWPDIHVTPVLCRNGQDMSMTGHVYVYAQGTHTHACTQWDISVARTLLIPSQTDNLWTWIIIASIKFYKHSDCVCACMHACASSAEGQVQKLGGNIFWAKVIMSICRFVLATLILCLPSHACIYLELEWDTMAPPY